jgi:hypothetical protein
VTGPDVEHVEAAGRWLSIARAELVGSCPAGDEDGPFRITVDGQASWALRKIREAQAEQARIKALAEDEIARIEQWATDADRPLQGDVDYFTGLLVDYYRRLKEANPKLPRTYKLPDGHIAARKDPDSLDVKDEAAFIAWATEHLPDAVPPKVLKSKLNDDRFAHEDGKVIDTTTGEVVPGVALTVGEDQIKAKAT